MTLNRCEFIGNLGKDPEIRNTNSGGKVASFSVGTTEKWKDNQGQQQDRTEWANCTIFGKLAEVVEKYVHKGDKVYVAGKMNTEKYTDKNGVEKYSTKIIVRELEMLTPKNKGQMASANNAPTSQNTSNQPVDDMGDEIPF